MANAVTKEQRQRIKDLVLNTVRLVQGKIDENPTRNYINGPIGVVRNTIIPLR